MHIQKSRTSEPAPFRVVPLVFAPTLLSESLEQATFRASHISRGNKCHLMAKSFLREKTEAAIFGIWPVGYSGPRSPRKAAALNMEEKAQTVKNIYQDKLRARY